jgi:AraC family L-rhamnose operon transcriptional activator RhaR
MSSKSAGERPVYTVPREQVFSRARPNVFAELISVADKCLPHSHGFLELAIVVSGAGTYHSAAGKHRLGRGSVVLTLPGEWHGYQHCAPISVWNLYIALEVREAELAGFRGDSLLGLMLWEPHVPARIPRRLSTGLKRAPVGTVDDEALAVVEGSLRSLAEHTPHRSGDTALRVGLLLQILGEISDALVGAPAGALVLIDRNFHPAVVTAIRLLDARPEDQWSLRLLADRVHLSPGYLVRLFTRDIGISPIAYLTQLRAERAAALLIETHLTVTEIGQLVGWRDPAYASRRFVSVFGLSPRAYRATFRSSTERAPTAPFSAPSH